MNICGIFLRFGCQAAKWKRDPFGAKHALIKLQIFLSEREKERRGVRDVARTLNRLLLQPSFDQEKERDINSSFIECQLAEEYQKRIYTREKCPIPMAVSKY